jgi:hypothetical protein
MSVLNNGLEKRIIEVTEQTSDDSRVGVACELFYKFLEQLMGYVEFQLISNLEDAVTQLRLCEVEAGYRIGLTDGMQLQQEVNAIRRGGWE